MEINDTRHDEGWFLTALVYRAYRRDLGSAAIVPCFNVQLGLDSRCFNCVPTEAGKNVTDLYQQLLDKANLPICATDGSKIYVF